MIVSIVNNTVVEKLFLTQTLLTLSLSLQHKHKFDKFVKVKRKLVTITLQNHTKRNYC